MPHRTFKLPEVDPKSIGLVNPDLLIGNGADLKLSPDVPKSVRNRSSKKLGRSKGQSPNSQKAQINKKELTKSNKKNVEKVGSLAVYPNLETTPDKVVVSFVPPRNEQERESTGSIILDTGKAIDLNSFTSKVLGNAEVVLIPKSELVKVPTNTDFKSGVSDFTEKLHSLLPSRVVLPETVEAIKELAS